MASRKNLSTTLRKLLPTGRATMISQLRTYKSRSFSYSKVMLKCVLDDVPKLVWVELLLRLASRTSGQQQQQQVAAHPCSTQPKESAKRECADDEHESNGNGAEEQRIIIKP